MAGQTPPADQIYFSATTNITDKLVAAINAEPVTGRIDMSIWHLTEGAITTALLNRFNAGVPIRLIGDRAELFELNAVSKNEFYKLANAGVPIRVRVNPTWYPEINHWKMTIFAAQKLAAFGSANYTPFELAPVSSTNYKDETVLFTYDPVIVNAVRTKFDQIWNDTKVEPESLIAGPPYLKDWNDACETDHTGSCDDYHQLYPNPKPMIISTARLEPDNQLPPDIIWGQGSLLNNRLIQEINNETTLIQFVIFRLTVSNITNALLNKKSQGVPIQLLAEPQEYENRAWPEFWLTHANLDRLWAAGVPIKMRVHQGLTHMKTLVTSNYATNASSNYAAAWQRDVNYFIPKATKSTIYQAIKNRVTAMWNDPAAFANFQPKPPDAAALAEPASGAVSVAATTSLIWNRATFATDYDVYLGTSSSNMTKVANVPAQLVNDPPQTYSWKPASPLQAGVTYYWRVVSRTFATPVNASMIANSSIQTFTIASAAPPPPPPGTAVPAPWTAQDIGAVGRAGTASYSNNVFTITAAGADIWGSADSFHYVSQPISGDIQIVARLTRIDNTNTYAKAGIMLRESAAANAAHVLLGVNPGGAIEFMTRSATGGQTAWLAGASQAVPAWLKLVRSGTTVTGYVSSNGTTWSTVGSTTLSIAASARVGLIVTSHDAAVLNTSTFDSVAVTAGTAPPPPPSGVPAPWSASDVGAVGRTGSASYSNGVFTVNAAGADIWGSADSFHYVSQPISGDTQIVARLTRIDNTNTYAKAGVMLRESVAANAAHVLLGVNPSGAIEFMTRSATGGQTAWLAGATQPAPAWLKLVRTGTTVTGYVSSNGTTWSTVGSTMLSIASSARVGLMVTSHDTALLNTSTFDSVAVTAVSAQSPPPPPPSASNIVVYASDIPASALHGSWSHASDATSPGGVKLATSDIGFAQLNNALASPTEYVDVSVPVVGGVPYTIWLRLKAKANSKSNDAVWVQFSNARVNGAAAYPMQTTSGLLVNLATDSTATSLNNWGWQNGAYWLSQPVTVTFPTSGTSTLRIQIREDGVELDQIVLSPSNYLNASPGKLTNDTTIVPKP